MGTDGLTLKTSLTITNERITLTAETDDGNAPTLVLDNITGATSGTSNDLNYISGQDNAMMEIELSAANVTRYGGMRLTITDASNHAPVIEDFMVISAEEYDRRFGVESLKTLLGIPTGPSVMLTTGHSTTAGRLAAGDYAKAKAGQSYIWVPATNDLHKIKTLSADTNGDWTVDALDAFATDPQGATYYLITVGINLPLNASTDFSGNVPANLLAINSSTALLTAFADAIGSVSVATCNTGCTATLLTVKTITPAIGADDQLVGGIVKFARDTATAALRNANARIVAVDNGASPKEISLDTAQPLPATPAEDDVFVVL
jgi:hypothetical protein